MQFTYGLLLMVVVVHCIEIVFTEQSENFQASCDSTNHGQRRYASVIAWKLGFIDVIKRLHFAGFWSGGLATRHGPWTAVLLAQLERTSSVSSSTLAIQYLCTHTWIPPRSSPLSVGHHARSRSNVLTYTMSKWMAFAL
jgi:hypothetical protein